MLYVRADGRGGSLYDPLGMLELCQLKNAPGAPIGFWARAARGGRYTFSGRDSAGRVVGILRRSSAPRGVPGDSVRLTFQEVPVQTLAPASGVYSSVSTFEDGDLGGTDVVLFVRGDSAWGALTVYQGAPMAPMAVGARLRGARLPLLMVEGRDTLAATLQLQSAGAVLTWASDDSTERLKKQSLASIFGKAPLTHCVER